MLCRRRKNNPLLVGDPGVGKLLVVVGAVHAGDAQGVLGAPVSNMEDLPEGLYSVSWELVEVQAEMDATRLVGHIHKEDRDMLLATLGGIDLAPDVVKGLGA